MPAQVKKHSAALIAIGAVLVLSTVSFALSGAGIDRPDPADVPEVTIGLDAERPAPTEPDLDREGDEPDSTDPGAQSPDDGSQDRAEGDRREVVPHSVRDASEGDDDDAADEPEEEDEPDEPEEEDEPDEPEEEDDEPGGSDD